MNPTNAEKTLFAAREQAGPLQRAIRSVNVPLLTRIFHGFRQPDGVAQASSLPYRGFPIRRCRQAATACRPEVGDTAGWKPALRSLGSPVPFLGREISGLTELEQGVIGLRCYKHGAPNGAVPHVPRCKRVSFGASDKVYRAVSGRPLWSAVASGARHRFGAGSVWDLRAPSIPHSALRTPHSR